jgi:hypothetical protein
MKQKRRKRTEGKMKRRDEKNDKRFNQNKETEKKVRMTDGGTGVSE